MTAFKKSGGRCSVSAVASAPIFRLKGRGGSPSGPKIQAQRAVSSNPNLPRSLPVTRHSPPYFILFFLWASNFSKINRKRAGGHNL